MLFVSITARVDGVEDIVKIVALVITGPMVGVEIGVAAFTNPIFDRLPDAAYRQARSDNRIGTWTEATDASRSLALRWDRLHWLRVAILVALFALLAVGAV